MAGKEWAVFTVMCMLHDGKGNILVEDRRSSHWPGIAFPGGHVEPGESFVQAAVREMQEETGLKVIASGGVSSLEDIAGLKARGVYGAVLGKSIYSGAIDLKEAIQKFSGKAE